MFAKVDYEQIVGEVKERNLFHKTLLEIKMIAEDSSASHDIEKYKAHLQAILEICEKSLANIT